jgi:hypothetical protein
MVFMGGTLRLSGREGFSNPDRLAELFLALPERAAKSVSRPRVSSPGRCTGLASGRSRDRCVWSRLVELHPFIATTAMANACRAKRE